MARLLQNTSPKPLFDADLRALRRARARALGFADFLHRHAAQEVKERLTDIARNFDKTAIVSGFPEVWADSLALPGADLVSDEDTLNFPAAGYDLVVHGLSLHSANDPVGQIIQCRRVLRPDGLFLAVLTGGDTLRELRQVLAQAESELRGGMAPRVAPMGDVRDLGALLQRAGLALPVADTAPLDVSYRGLTALMHDLRAMGETNVLTARDPRGLTRAIMDRASTLYGENFATEDNRMTAHFDLVTLTGWAPDDSQQKPLRPGSASNRLADALNTDETTLRDND